MMWWHSGGVGWGGWLVMSVVLLAFWALIVAGAVVLWRSVRSPSTPDPQTRDGDARRVLDERFARGEIDESEYTRRRDLLSSGR